MTKGAAVSGFFQGNRTMAYLLITLILLVVSDGVITQFLIRTGLGSEGNALLKNVVGQDAFVLLKAAGAVLCAFILWDMHRRWYKLAFISTICFVVLYAGIVLWNLAVFFIAGGSNAIPL